MSGIFLSFNQLNISRVDIAYILENDGKESGRSTQPVTLYITVDITPPNLDKTLPSIPTEDNDSLAEATTPGRIQFTAPEHLLPPSHHQRVETDNTMPQSQEEVLPSAKNLRSALDSADEALKRIVPTDRSNNWERAVERIKWVMDTLGPIAEVRVMLFDIVGRANLQTQLSPYAKMAHGLLFAIPKARPFVSFSERDAHSLFA